MTVRDVDPTMAISTSTQLLSSADIQVQGCFTSTETIRTIRDGEPRTATSTFTQLLSSAHSPHLLDFILISSMASVPQNNNNLRHLKMPIVYDHGFTHDNYNIFS